MLFWLKKLISGLILPPGFLILLSIAGLLLLRRKPRLATGMLWAASLGLLALSLPPVEHLLHTAAGSDPALDPAQARGAQAIVILGGGIRRAAPEYGGDTVGKRTLVRVRYGARLAKRYKLPVLVSGGTVFGGIAEAQAMRESLELDFGLSPRWTESASRDTAENAHYSAAPLRAAGVSRILLVTDGYHMRRASQLFKAEGFDVVAAPTEIAGGRESSDLLELLPNTAAFDGSRTALHELLGQAADRIRQAWR